MTASISSWPIAGGWKERKVLRREESLCMSGLSRRMSSARGRRGRARRRGCRRGRARSRRGRCRGGTGRSASPGDGRRARPGRRRPPAPPPGPRRPRASPSGGTRKRTQAPPTGSASGISTGSPRAAARARPFRSIPSAAWQSSASWPPPRRAASSMTRGPSGPSTICVYVGPSVTPRASAARRAASTASSTACALGQACASATPKAGSPAVSLSVTVSGWKRPPTENAFTVTSGPGTSSSTRASPVREA